MSMAAVATMSKTESISILCPDDWHLHVRDGSFLKSVVPHTAQHFRRAVIMPNLKPPIISVQQALRYKQEILDAVPPTCTFQPLMTLYLTDGTTSAEVRAAKAAGIVAYKLYPAGATTNSQSGVTDISNCVAALEAMAEEGLLLLVHGEVTDNDVDMFDREKVFIENKLKPILEQVPGLRIVLEHITTREATEFVASASPNVAATITPQHITLNRNSLFQGGLRPHTFCLPILKREEHRRAVLAAAISGNPKFFLGTDSAPHPKGAKESACGCAGIFSSPVALAIYAQAFEAEGALSKLEGFASLHGPKFYGVPVNTHEVVLKRNKWKVPDEYNFGNATVVPMFAGQYLDWKVEALNT